MTRSVLFIKGTPSFWTILVQAAHWCQWRRKLQMAESFQPLTVCAIKREGWYGMALAPVTFSEVIWLSHWLTLIWSHREMCPYSEPSVKSGTAGTQVVAGLQSIWRQLCGSGARGSARATNWLLAQGLHVPQHVLKQPNRYLNSNRTSVSFQCGHSSGLTLPEMAAMFQCLAGGWKLV